MLINDQVTSYGHIARLLGRRECYGKYNYVKQSDECTTAECPRQVGVCLKHLPSQADQPDATYHSNNVPWQRVINSKGGISPR